MANRYWVGGTATWDATAGTKWATTSGGAGGAAVPTANDSVFFDGNSGTGTVTISGSRVCLDLDTTGFKGTMNFGSSTVTVGNGASTSSFYIDDTTGSFNFGTSTVVANNILVQFTTISGLVLAINNLTVNSPSTFNPISDLTIATLTFAPSSALQVYAGGTITVTTLVAEGTAGNLIFISSDTPSSSFDLSIASGIVDCDYLDLTDCHAVGGATFYAGSHSNNNGNNTGWSFTDAPTGTIIPPLGTMSLSGQVPSPKISYAVPAGSLTTTGNNPTVQVSTIIAPPAGSLALASNLPVTKQEYRINLGSLTLTGRIPVGAIGLLIPAGSLTLSGSAPLLLAVLAAPQGSLTASALAPVGLNQTIFFIPQGSLLMTTYEEISISNPQHTYREKQPKAGLATEGFWLGELEPSFGLGYAITNASGTLAGSAPVFRKGYGIPLGTLTLTGNIPTYTNA